MKKVRFTQSRNSRHLRVPPKKSPASFLLFSIRHMKQLTLIKEKKYAARKCARPISLRGANHIALKSKRPILRWHQAVIRELIRETQYRFGLKIRALAVMEDHVHLVVKVSSRKQFADALGFLAGGIAQKLTLAKLWTKRAWSRPINVARDLQTVETYVARNSIKAGLYTTGDAYFILNGILQL